MDFLVISSFIIPGYQNISQNIKQDFETSHSGKKLVHLVEKTQAAYDKLNSSFWLWEYYTGGATEKRKALFMQLESQKNTFLQNINTTQEYKVLLRQLTLQLLEKEINDFKFLNQEQKESLSEASFSQDFFVNIAPLIEKIEHYEDTSIWSALNSESLNSLVSKKNGLIAHWLKQFKQQSNIEALQKTIDDNKELSLRESRKKQRSDLNEHANQLSTSFPLLHHKKLASEDSFINQLRAKYFPTNEEVVADPTQIDEEQITDALFYCIKQVTQIELNFIELDDFNRKYAHELSLSILKSVNDKTALNLDEWFKKYEQQLNRYLVEQLQFAKGKTLQFENNAVVKSVMNSLSYLWDNPITNSANKFMSKLGDAHGFIQATGFSTQNESSFLAIIDIYNYARNYEQIAETRSMLTNLAAPLTPLFNEYKDIAFYEKNPYWKFFRMMIPILIIAAVVIITAVALAPLVLPDMVLIAALIPALLVGMAAATQYAALKSTLYKYVRELYYGGPFEIPEFTVNARMTKAFGTAEQAEKVRSYYISALKNYDDIEIEYASKHKQGTLDQKEIDTRKENTKNRIQLALEWYDIHSNKDLSYEQSHTIFLNRLQKDTEQSYQKLKQTVKEELNLIHESVAQVAIDVKTTIVSHNVVPLVSTNDDVITIKAHCRYNLFSSLNSHNVKTHVEHLVTLKEETRASGMQMKNSN